MTQISEIAEEPEVTGPYIFADILNGLVDGVSPINVLPTSLAGEPAPLWTTLHYKPLWNSPGVATAFKVAVWLFGAFSVYLAIRSFIPYSLRGVLSVVFPLLLGLHLWHRKTAANSIGRLWLWQTAKTLGVAALLFVAVTTFTTAGTGPHIASLFGKTQTAWLQIKSWWQPASPTQSPSAVEPVETVTIDPSNVTLPPQSASTSEETTAVPQTPKDSVEETIDFATLALHRTDWPKEVTLKKTVVFPALFEGKIVGHLQVPLGSSVQLLSMNATQVTLRYHDATQTVAIGTTDLADRVQTAHKKAPVERAQPVPQPSQLRNTIAKTVTKPPVELPGLDVQASSYFGSKR